jgi:hypothetical protein
MLVFTKLHSGIKHEGLCKKDDNDHKKARVAVYHGKEKEKLQLCEENVRLANEVATKKQKIAQLQNISKDLFEKAARLESEMEKLGIAKKEKCEMTEIEIRQYHDGVRSNFDMLRYIVEQGDTYQPIVDRMKICVLPDASRKASFCLQTFLDNISSENYKASAFSRKTDFDKCREVLFGDILTLSEVEAAKAKRTKPKNIITTALISEWNVVFGKNEIQAKGVSLLWGPSFTFLNVLIYLFGITAQKDSDTAIDLGGPLRQFLSDAMLQMRALSVPVEVLQ